MNNAKTFRSSIDNRTDDLKSLLHELEQTAVYSGMPPGARFCVDLALDELVSNVIKYGGGSGRSIDVEIAFDGQALVVVLVDHGNPFNPHLVSTPQERTRIEDLPVGGRGIHMVRGAFDQWDYHYADGCNVNRLTKTL